MLGLPQELYTPLFAVARIAGWSAHRMEELGAGGGDAAGGVSAGFADVIGRPRSLRSGAGFPSIAFSYAGGCIKR